LAFASPTPLRILVGVARKSKPLPILIAFAGLIIVTGFFGCEKKAPPPENPLPPSTSPPRPSPPERVTENSPDAILATLHHAAQEMALDGFQFDRRELGWPQDCGAPTTTAYLESLTRHGYLSAQDLVHFAEIEIANLSDSDPGETAFAKLPHKGKTHLIRKDGRIESTPILPPRDPAWLPQ
jgi:hypothetical protein